MRLFIWGLAFVLTQASYATHGDFIADSLARPLIDTDQAWREVSDYTHTKVPTIPAVRSAARWTKEADRLRQAVLDRIVFRDDISRAWRDAKVAVDWLETIEGGAGYVIRKLRYEVLPGLWIPALLYEPEHLNGSVAVMLAVNGHDELGKASDYKQVRCINLAKRGMLVLNIEWVGIGQLRTEGFSHYRMNQLDLCGVSGIAVHFLAQKRALDILLAHPNADSSRVAVSGLSGGGWQTIFLSSLDTRVTFCNPVAGYSSFRTRVRHFGDLGDSEQTPSDLATIVDYTHLTALMAPRAVLLTYNAFDNCCFAASHALPPLLEAAAPIYKILGANSNLRHHVNYHPGTHNYLQENREALYRSIGDLFYQHDPQFVWQEFEVSSELKSAAQLDVPLPEDNLDFHRLADVVRRKLPMRINLPSESSRFRRWQKERRAKLSEVVRAYPSLVKASQHGNEAVGGTTATWWLFRIDEVWTVPAVEFVRGMPTETVVLVGDGGRKDLGVQVAALLEANKRVIAVDPFYFGESKISKSDYLYALLVAAVGDRPLGLQASQLASISRWAQKRFGQAVAVQAIGPRTSLFALVAAGLEDKAIGRLELVAPLSSLHDVVENNWSADQYPELFCFGLLSEFDLPQLEALVFPRVLAKDGVLVKSGSANKPE